MRKLNVLIMKNSRSPPKSRSKIGFRTLAVACEKPQMPFKDQKPNQGTEAGSANDGAPPLMGNSKQLQYICDKMKNEFMGKLFAIPVSRIHVCFPNYKRNQGDAVERSVATMLNQGRPRRLTKPNE